MIRNANNQNFPYGSVVKNSHIIQETKDMWVPYVGSKGNGNPLQYSCLENSMDRGA